jgi:hypothetical protein
MFEWHITQPVVNFVYLSDLVFSAFCKDTCIIWKCVLLFYLVCEAIGTAATPGLLCQIWKCVVIPSVQPSSFFFCIFLPPFLCHVPSHCILVSFYLIFVIYTKEPG